MSQLGSPSQQSLFSSASQPGSSLDLMPQSNVSFSSNESSQVVLTPRPKGFINNHWTKKEELDGVWRYCKVEGCTTRYAARNSTSVFRKHTNKKHGIGLEDSKKTVFTFHDDLHVSRLIKLVIDGKLSYRLIARDSFKLYVHSLNPNKPVIGRKYLSELVNRGRLKLTEMLCDKLTNVESIALTFDIWSPSKGARGFGCVTGHHVSSTGNLESVTLHFKRMKFPHDAKAICEFIDKAIRMLKLEGRVVAITTDNASNNIAGIRSLCNSTWLTPLNLGPIHYKCVAHILDLGMRDSVAKLKEIVNPARELVMAVRSSRKRKEAFFDQQKKLIETGEQSGKKVLDLIEDVDHRWNSTFALLERAYNLRLALDHISTTSGLDMLDRVDWGIIEEIIKFLRPFFEATNRLCSAEDVTLSVVSYTIPRLIEHCALYEHDENEWISRAACAMLAKLTDYELEIYKPVADLAYFLDPRYKTKNLLQEGRDRVIEQVRKLINEIPAPQSETSVSSGVNSFLGSDSEVEEQSDEISEYLRSKRERQKINAFAWWKLNSENYPKLSAIARRILPIQATSVASEREFSEAGDVDTKKRNRLDDESVESIVLVKSWMDYLKFD